MAKWVINNKQADFKNMSDVLEISEYMAKLLVNKDINTKGKCERYLNPKEENLRDFGKAKDVNKACDILRESIKNNDKIVVYGDYDVDGVMSTTILYKALRDMYENIDISYYIPHREHEGYGLNLEAVKKLHADNIDLIITCDNGIVSMLEVELIKELGMKVIVIDHHEPTFVEKDGVKVDVIPNADAVIDPKQKACEYEFKEMCAGGLTYRFVCYYALKNNINIKIKTELLVFSMIATICDIVDLQEDNRIIASNGLYSINNIPIHNKGLKQLLIKKSIDEKKLTVYDMGFIIGPCINAGGRLDKATLGVELFTCEDDEIISNTADKLVSLNDERKKMTADAFDKVDEIVINNKYYEDKVIVVYDDNIHESIAGIVAGRIKEKYYRPTIVLTKGATSAKGSARSIIGYNIYEALFEVRHLFNRFGGHYMAAGLSIDYDKVNVLRDLLNENCKLNDDDFVETIKIDRQLVLNDVTYSLADDIQVMQPFGKGNHEPVFGSKNVLVTNLRIIDDKNMMILSFGDDSTSRQIKAVCFGKVDQFKEMIVQEFGEYVSTKIFAGVLRNIAIKLDIVYYIDINEYNGNKQVQIKLKDFRLSKV